MQSSDCFSNSLQNLFLFLNGHTSITTLNKFIKTQQQKCPLFEKNSLIIYNKFQQRRGKKHLILQCKEAKGIPI